MNAESRTSTSCHRDLLVIAPQTRIERFDLVGIVHGANLAHDRRFPRVLEHPLALKRIAVGADDFKPEERANPDDPSTP